MQNPKNVFTFRRLKRQRPSNELPPLLHHLHLWFTHSHSQGLWTHRKRRPVNLTRRLRILEYVRIWALHLLNKVWLKYNVEIGYGCQTNDPSQKKHPCLEQCDCFYQLHFEPIMKSLWNENFISAVSLFMAVDHLHVDWYHIQEAVEVLLNHLNYVDNAYDTIQKMYETMDGEDRQNESTNKAWQVVGRSTRAEWGVGGTRWWWDWRRRVKTKHAERKNEVNILSVL